MERREFLNTAENFAEIVSLNKQFIEKRYAKIVRLQDAQKAGIQLYPYDNLRVIRNTRNTIVLYYLNTFFAGYSMGLPTEELKALYLRALNEMSIAFRDTPMDDFSYRGSEPFYGTDEYWNVLQMLSLGVLLNVSKEEATQILAIRDKVPAPDVLLDYLCACFDGRKHSWEQSTGDRYNGLVKTLRECTPENAAALFQTYLKKQWFRDYRRQGLLPTHENKNHNHPGYWSFESGAILKILRADDSILRGQQYYPYDMVHWQ